MPEVVVYILEGRSARAEARLRQRHHRGRGEKCRTTAEQVTVSLVETAKRSKGKGGVLFSEMAPR